LKYKHTHCTHDIIAHKHIVHVTLSRTYTLHTWYYCTHDFTWVDNFPRKTRVNTNVFSFL